MSSCKGSKSINANFLHNQKAPTLCISPNFPSHHCKQSITSASDYMKNYLHTTSNQTLQLSQELLPYFIGTYGDHNRDHNRSCSLHLGSNKCILTNVLHFSSHYIYQYITTVHRKLLPYFILTKSEDIG